MYRTNCTQNYPCTTKTKEGENKIGSNQLFSKGVDYVIREQDKLPFRTQKEKPNHAIVSFHKEYIFSFENINRLFEYDEYVKK